MKAGLVLSFVAIMLLSAGPAVSQSVPGEEWTAVAAALGRVGEERDAVYRVAFPRSDLRVRVGGVTLRTGLALTSWAAFQKAAGAAMVMGDLVLAAGEVATVASALVEGGMEITAIHNHLIGEQPRVMYLHFHGHGDAAALATTLRGALARTATPLASTRPGRPRETPSPDAEELSRILGHRGALRSGVVSFSIPRGEMISGGGAGLGPRMGLATAIHFQAEGSGGVATGDFVLVAAEVQPVIRALREHGVEVTALHNHLLDEQPRLFFLHFWGRGETSRIARGLRAALDRTNHTRPQ